MAVTVEDVKRVASLARLELGPAEEERLAADLGRILAYMEKLNQLDTRGVEPTAHAIPVAGAFRQDRTEVFDARGELLEQAPDMRDGYFTVPRVID